MRRLGLAHDRGEQSLKMLLEDAFPACFEAFPVEGRVEEGCLSEGLTVWRKAIEDGFNVFTVWWHMPEREGKVISTCSGIPALTTRFGEEPTCFFRFQVWDNRRPGMLGRGNILSKEATMKVWPHSGRVAYRGIINRFISNNLPTSRLAR